MEGLNVLTLHDMKRFGGRVVVHLLRVDLWIDGRQLLANRSSFGVPSSRTGFFKKGNCLMVVSLEK